MPDLTSLSKLAYGDLTFALYLTAPERDKLIQDLRDMERFYREGKPDVANARSQVILTTLYGKLMSLRNQLPSLEYQQADKVYERFRTQISDYMRNPPVPSGNVLVLVEDISFTDRLAAEASSLGGGLLSKDTEEQSALFAFPSRNQADLFAIQAKRRGFRTSLQRPMFFADEMIRRDLERVRTAFRPAKGSRVTRIF